MATHQVYFKGIYASPVVSDAGAKPTVLSNVSLLTTLAFADATSPPLTDLESTRLYKGEPEPIISDPSDT